MAVAYDETLMNPILAGLLLAIMAISACGRGSTEEPSFEKALQLARTNLETPQGKEYDAQLAKYSEGHLPEITRACVEAEKPSELAPFQLLLEVSGEGSISKAMVGPAANVGKCVRDKVQERGQAPRPPHAGYWALIEVGFSP